MYGECVHTGRHKQASFLEAAPSELWPSFKTRWKGETGEAQKRQNRGARGVCAQEAAITPG